jgi:UDP-N-acetylmuramoyl-tripeptide--D-alanyl-D-alanine ligase
MELNNLYQLYLACGQRVFTDTRKIIEGGIFFALKGSGFNGNTFAQFALENGASYVVVDEKTTSFPDKTIYVDSVIETLQSLASHHRNQSKALFLAIGGSNGKTTTKELLQRVVSTKYKVHATPGNFNNHIGLPLTLLSMPLETDVCLLELGTNQPGDIALLCSICNPSAGILTNIGKEHLEGFGSIDAVALEESHLYDHLLKNKGVVFINNDDPWLHSMSSRFTNPIVFSILDFIVKQVVPTIALDSMEGVQYYSPLSGLHNVSNIAAVRSIGLYLGIDEQQIAHAISSYRPDNMRSEWRQTEDNLVFLDAYNANPSSMIAAIDTIKAYKDRPKIAILGDMFELGSHAKTEHEAVFQYAINAGFEKVITVGENFAGVNLSDTGFEKIEDLKKEWDHTPLKGYVVLVKASRGMKLEELMSYL